MKINIVSRDNGVGLSRDIRIVSDLLPDHQTTFREFGTKPDPLRERADLNIFVELVSARWFQHAKMNIVIPNPEWYDVRWRQFLPRFDAVLCKSRSAVNSFSVISKKCKFISFTSPDRFDPQYDKNENRWLHVAGKSGQKGTDMVYETWANNPDFPHLTILQDPIKAKPREPIPNVTLIYDHVTDQELVKLQNECGVHVCPSECEGFGHYIMEAMSARAVVITTNGPPMNELVTKDRGVLVNWSHSVNQKFASSFYATSEDLAESVRATVGTGELERNQMRERARTFYEENDAFFRQAFSDAISGLTYAKPSFNTMLAQRRFPRRHA